MPVELVLRDIHHANLEHRVGLGLEDQILQAAPGALDLLELRRMHDFVHLRRKLLVELRDHLLDRVEHVGLDEAGIGQRLLDQRLDGVLDFGRGALGARLEALLQQRRELVRISGLGLRVLLLERTVSVAMTTLSNMLRWFRTIVRRRLLCSTARFFNACISCGSANSLRS